jgi:hypothetical protein
MFLKYTSREPVKMVQQTHESRPEDYLYSSAKGYAVMKGPVKVSLIELHSLFYS